MSVRRRIGDVVQLDEEDDGPYLAKIAEHGRGTAPDDCMRVCGDPDCKEWPVLAEVDAAGKLTGVRVFHVAECQMAEPGSKAK